MTPPDQLARSGAAITVREWDNADLVVGSVRGVHHESPDRITAAVRLTEDEDDSTLRFLLASLWLPKVRRNGRAAAS